MDSHGKKEFLRNLASSAVAYIVASFLGLLGMVPLWGWGYISSAFGISRDTPEWVAIIIMSILIISGVIGPAAFLFFWGKKMNLLGKHWLNFLSVSGFLVVSVILSVVSRDSELLFFSILPLFAAFLLITRSIPVFFHDILMGVMAILPPTIMWLGMLPKWRKSRTDRL